jgi:hypothetical protein
MILNQLDTLKWVNAKPELLIDPVIARREKLCKKINEQIALGQATLKGEHYTPTRLRMVPDPDTGYSKTIEVPKRMKPWWWQNAEGRYCIAFRYGSKVIELSKGKTAVEVDSLEAVCSTLEVVKLAVIGGELDSQLESVSHLTKKGFTVVSTKTRSRKKDAQDSLL